MTTARERVRKNQLFLLRHEDSRMKEQKEDSSKAKRTESRVKNCFFPLIDRKSTWTRQERRAERNDGRPDTGKEEGKDR